MFLSPRHPEVTILSTNQRRGCIARISRDPFRRLVSFSVPQRRSPENEARTGTATSGSRPLLAVETRPRSAPLRSDPFCTLQWKRGIRPHLTSLPEVHGAMFFLTTGMLAAFPANYYFFLWRPSVKFWVPKLALSCQNFENPCFRATTLPIRNPEV